MVVPFLQIENCYKNQNFLLSEISSEILSCRVFFLESGGPAIFWSKNGTFFFQYGRATTQNPKLQGKPFYVRDKGVLSLLDPYLSTTQKDHRSFKPDELKKYPKKDIATTWQCEDMPKSWGHGLKHK